MSVPYPHGDRDPMRRPGSLPPLGDVPDDIPDPARPGRRADAPDTRPDPAWPDPLRPDPGRPEPARPDPARPDPARPWPNPDGRLTFVGTGRGDRHLHVVDVASGEIGDPTGLRARCGAPVERIVPGMGAAQADCTECGAYS